MYANVCGLKSKKVGLTAILQESRPQLFLLAETQLRCDTSEKFDGYQLYSRKREGKVGGGVGILVRNDIAINVASHKSDRNIEITWVFIRQKGTRPLIVGTYYGRQETTNKNEIEQEMHLLTEEIEDMKSEGEILLLMDGNAKLGLLGEETSRNGGLLKKVFEYTGLNVVNNNPKCNGEITRRKNNNEDEFSAIDFILASDEAEKWIENALIDEAGIYKIKGKKESDHNTIIVNINIPKLEKIKTVKQVGWNIGAPEEKWEKFKHELDKRCEKATAIITDKSKDMEYRYKMFCKEISDAAMNSIGKTTFKTNSGRKETKDMKVSKNKKKELKKEIMAEKNDEKRKALIEDHKKLQELTKALLVKEKTEEIKQKLERIISDKTGKSLWKEKRFMSRDPALDSMVVKDANGHRQFSPESIKEATASYYQNLYKQKEFPYHPYHKEVEAKMLLYVNDRTHEHDRYNSQPNIEEIVDIIGNKKNGKSTPDFKNEMLKKPGMSMLNMLVPLVRTTWDEETIFRDFNLGFITSLFKGKGDKEDLKNYRGITTSSSIGTIFDALIDNRIESVVPFTQAQGGGKRGASTCDHTFLIRAIIDIAIKRKSATYITFYDVSKAYDNVNNDDLLTIMWEKGLRGKSWRILNNLNKNLRAMMKTRFGTTREIDMEIGGKQGSRLTGRMFAKLMDMLAEELSTTGEGFIVNEMLIIAVLLWVDDVVSCVEGEENQLKMLEKVHDFALRHRLVWGQNKCKVMRVGKHKGEPKEWNLGDLKIEETSTYKYLGDVISDDGKNAKNLEARQNKTIATTVTINSIASGEVLRKIETQVLIELHEKATIPGLLGNAESWNLNRGEKANLERIEVQALKSLFDLPAHTPTPAIIFTLGTLYTNVRVDKMRFMYLHRILNRDGNHWTKKTLDTLVEMEIGWGKSIKEALTEYNLPTDFDEIARTHWRQWKRLITQKTEIMNRNRLLEDCHKTEDGDKVPKTKTAHIIPLINSDTFIREPQKDIIQCNKYDSKTIMIARFRMLDCGRNFKGTKPEICNTCNCVDDENHRLNHCVKFRETNLYDSTEKVDFQNVYSNDIAVLQDIIPIIQKVWNTKTAHGTMNV